MRLPRWILAIVAGLLMASPLIAAEKNFLVFEGEGGPGKGKHVVLISGDEEYRSEEAMPQLGKILAQQHGFRCTVLFAIDEERGVVQPNELTNIPGLESLESADLMIIATRFRALRDEQMEMIDAYLKSGRPVIGLRTATHAFKFPNDSKWARYSFRYNGPEGAWRDGFGRLVLGETWINHHGHHKFESTRGLIAADAKGHPISRGLNDGDIWGPTDVYEVRLPLPGDSKPIVMGQVLAGMSPDDPPLAASDGKDKNDPMMPIAWTKSYRLPGGEKGRVFTTTMGASMDLPCEGVRRMIVQGAYWCVGLEDAIPDAGVQADLVGDFEPTMFGFQQDEDWIEKGLTVSDFE